MWYIGVNDYYYIDDFDGVWKVWKDGSTVQTSYDADVVRGLCKKIDKPAHDWVDEVLRSIS